MAGSGVVQHRINARAVGLGVLAAILQMSTAVAPRTAYAAQEVGDQADDQADKAADQMEDRAASASAAEELSDMNDPTDDRIDGDVPEPDVAEDRPGSDVSGSEGESSGDVEMPSSNAESSGEASSDDQDNGRDGKDDEVSQDRGSAGAFELSDLAAAERPEFDERGYPVRRGELVAMDLTPTARNQALTLGFTIIESHRLGGLPIILTRLAVPAKVRTGDALESLRKVDPAGLFDYAHYYGLNYRQAGRQDKGVGRIPSRGSWSVRGGGPRVGMIDTGITDHPTLTGIRIESRSFGSTINRRTDHGTAVASLLVHEGAGEIVAADVFRGKGPKSFTSADSIADALGWMVEQRVPVINMSLAGPRNIILDRVVARVLASGQIIVAAAGNEGPTAPPAYPAAQPDVVGVTAVDSRGRVYRYANRGAYIDVAALGVGVPAAAPGGWITPHSGTSFAAPHVAVVLARCARPSGQSNAACIDAMERRARDLGQPGRDPVYGAGLVE
jgi:hypothetical protein